MKSEKTGHYQSSAVRALVALHQREMHNFMVIWNNAVKMNVTLPPTEDPSCKTFDAMMSHVLHASRGYVRWICDQLNLTEPQIDRPSNSMNFLTESADYLESLLDVWSTALLRITDDECYVEFKSRWNTIYCIDGMLEHAVMHPVRHSFQLEKLM